MTKKMLIDARHAQERRVAILDQDKIVDFEVESSHKVSSKGSVFLGKIVRVEPSLQAAFVDYGADRHGFLAFSDIHYNYYQIPVADREALEKEKLSHIEASDFEDIDDDLDDAHAEASDLEPSHVEPLDEVSEEYEVEVVGDSSGDGLKPKETPSRAQIRKFYQRYKIQEVIKRGQVVLVQVVKDERGNKGAALTTYVSLPGRYCVLMPNALHRGGVSRKISDPKDRKRLRSILQELGLPVAMSIIVRTAGKDRNKLEIKKDCEYLLRLWQDICDKTIHSIAPAAVYEEANLVRQAMRDLYRKDIEEIIVDGKDAYNDARSYIKQLMPSHVKKVKLHKDTTPLFEQAGVESELEELYRSQVSLPSGGYLVINQTEALVSIDINSGKATRERNISETAFKTNLEATHEIARQLRLRNLAGLIVIDFIDMDYPKHISQVERKFREVMRDDRARVQIGQISQFGLLELSRQRLGVSYHETITQTCPVCKGHGIIPAPKMLALRVLRQVFQAARKQQGSKMTARVHPSLVATMLNEYRDEISVMEKDLGRKLIIEMDEKLMLDEMSLGNQRVAVLDDERTSDSRRRPDRPKKKFDTKPEPSKETAQPTEEVVAQEASPDVSQEERKPKRRRRRSRGRKQGVVQPQEVGVSESAPPPSEVPTETHEAPVVSESAPKKKRRWWGKKSES